MAHRATSGSRSKAAAVVGGRSGRPPSGSSTQREGKAVAEEDEVSGPSEAKDLYGACRPVGDFQKLGQIGEVGRVCGCVCGCGSVHATTRSAFSPPLSPIDSTSTHVFGCWQGAYGTVYRGLDKATGRTVALKRVILHNEKQDGFPLTSLREVRMLKKIAHPNCVRLLVRACGGGGGSFICRGCTCVCIMKIRCRLTD